MVDRQDIHEVSVLWRLTGNEYAEVFGPVYQSQAGSAADAGDGAGSDLSQTSSERGTEGNTGSSRTCSGICRLPLMRTSVWTC